MEHLGTKEVVKRINEFASDFPIKPALVAFFKGAQET